MTLLEKISYLIKNKNLNNRQLSLKSGIPYSTIDGWYKIGCENMRLSTFKTLCSFFGVTMDSMAYDELEIRYLDDVNAKTLTREEQEIIRMYAELDKDIQRVLRSTLKASYDIALEKKDAPASPSQAAG